MWSKLNLTNQPQENSAVSWISCNSEDLYGDHSYFVQLAKKNALKQICKLFLKAIAIIMLFQLIIALYIINYNKNNNVISYYNYEL